MNRPKLSLKSLVFIGSLLLIGLALVRWAVVGETPVSVKNRKSPPVPGVTSSETVAPDATFAARPPREPKIARKPVDSERAWQLADEEGRSFVLALDEAMLRDADGKETLVKLDPPATEATLPQRIANLGAWPVVYLTGEPRSEASRRVVTPDLRIRLDGADPVAVARAAAVEIKDLPEYAPGWAVLAAADPFAALHAMDHLRAAGHPSADVLLAAQRQKRAMPNDTLINNQWHFKNTNTTRTHINVESAWNYPVTGIRGAGIRIGIVDDGLQTAHPDLVTNVDTANDRDWNGNDSDPNPGSGDDHGTACAGNAGARGNNSLGVSGSAPESTLVGLRLIAGGVTDAQEAEAMAWSNDIIQIKSNSWGPSDTGAILEGPGSLTAAALQNATTNGRGGRGTLFLWAGGNGGGSSDNSNYDGYANSIHTVAIGASDSNGNRASYSEPGANVVVVAPSSGGTGITTTDRTGTTGYNKATTANGGDYTSTFGGTSSATPTAAGVVALMLEKNPNLGWRDVQEILIRSAYKIKPADADWSNNGAGIPFNHNFGAGLIDAAAAVNLANGWVNLTGQQSAPLAQTGLSVAIPDNNTTGITRSFDFSAVNLRVEHVTVRLSISHTYRGDLAITLTSPSGMSSRLAEKRADSNDNYSNWTFSSVRHWGESSAGTWTLKIADTAASDTGTLAAATITLFGAPSATTNPVPLVKITSPENGAVFSPGATVNVAVSASDFTGSGDPGTISQVELLQNGNVVGTDVTAPYTFAISPAIGNHMLAARATDSEGAVANSASISISVLNQTPVINAATLSAGAQGYADEGLTVDSVNASDPENDILSYEYQWQASTDGVVFTDDPAATASSLTASPTLAGKLWRCVVTVSDGENTSAPFTTAATNLLNRPPPTAEIGAAFGYDSGLVLRGGGSTLTRQAIIHEFSQGPAGGSSEWIEILTLQSGSLAFWDIQDAGGAALVFRDDPVWDDIPAGTLIVIYNGTAAKDPLLPADDTDLSDGRMILSSTNPAFFDATYDAWPALGNSGDAIFLSDADANTVHEIAYGNSTAATPNIGTVGSGEAAYYAGSNDEDANLVANWSVTTSLTARALLPGITLAGGNYSQVFNTAPGASGTAFPDGWTSYNGGTEDTSMSIGNSSSTAGGNYNYGSRIGILGSNSAFDPGSIVMAIQNTTGSSNLNIAYDVVKIREQSRSMDFKLQYSLTSPTSGFVDVPGGNYVSGNLAENTVSSFSVPLPSALDDQGSTIYLRWFYQTTAGSPGGSRDGLALDNVVISSGTVIPPLALAVSPSTFVENSGSNAATGTVSIPESLENDLIVMLTSSDPGEAAVPVSVTIIAGNTSANFAVDAINDLDSDGPQIVTLDATAEGHQPATFEVTVTDDEPSLVGVTPGGGNTPANIGFVNQLRSGGFGNPALFRLGTGTVLPEGLTLDPETGLLSGIIAPGNSPGDYPIVIERYNSEDEVVFQAFTLTLSGTPGGDFAAWIAGYPEVGELNGRLDDDGLPNAVENLLGTSPSAWNAGLVEVSASGGSLVFHHTFAAQPASDVTGSYEWSADLVNWHASGAESGGNVITISSEVVTDASHPEGWKRVTASATQGSLARCFVRLRAD
jgi:subtilisin-like proprotein convertase family protein